MGALLIVETLLPEAGDAACYFSIFDKILQIDIVNKDTASLNSAKDHVLEKPGNVKSG